MNDELPTPPITPLSPPAGAFEVVVGRARILRRRRLAVIGSGTTVVIALLAAIALATGGSPDEEVEAVSDPATTTTALDDELDEVAGTTTTATTATTATPATIPPVTTASTEPPPPTTAAPPPPPETTTTTPPTPEQAACAAPDGPDLAPPTTLEEYTARWTGTWVACGTGSVFCDSEAGVEIVADGTWWNLDRLTDGTFVRRTDPSQHGTWLIRDLSEQGMGTWQFELHKETGFYLIAWPTYEQDVPRVFLNNNGVCTGTYVRAGG